MSKYGYLEVYRGSLRLRDNESRLYHVERSQNDWKQLLYSSSCQRHSDFSSNCIMYLLYCMKDVLMKYSIFYKHSWIGSRYCLRFPEWNN